MLANEKSQIILNLMGKITPKKTPKYRIFELDFARGIFIIIMTFSHVEGYFGFLFFENIYNYDYHIYLIGFITIFGGCVIMSGINATFSKHNIRRAFYAVIVVTLLNFLIYWFSKATNINLSSLNQHGLVLLLALFTLCFWLLNKLPAKMYLFFCGAVFIIQCAMFDSWLSTKYIETNIPILSKYYIDIMVWFWRPVFISLFLIGTLIGKAYYKNKHSPLVLGHLNDNKFCKPILWIGRNSLYIFIAQIFILPLIYLFFQLFV